MVSVGRTKEVTFGQNSHRRWKGETHRHLWEERCEQRGGTWEGADAAGMAGTLRGAREVLVVRVGSKSSGGGRAQNQGLEALRSRVRGRDDLEQWGEMGLMYAALQPSLLHSE